jgi:aspartate kinase
MKVLKFGGTSVGSAARIKDVAKLICDGDRKIVVLSAMSGTTNSLVEISDYFYKMNTTGALERINVLEQKYMEVIDELYSTEQYKTEAKVTIKSIFEYLRSFSKAVFTLFEEKAILAQGEMLSTNMFQLYLLEQGQSSVLLPALDYMKIDKNAEPDTAFIADNLGVILKKQADFTYYITQGYICRNFYGEIDNLQRGGSDYSASLIGAAVRASEIQIWTDIDGMHKYYTQLVFCLPN